MVLFIVDLCLCSDVCFYLDLEQKIDTLDSLSHKMTAEITHTRIYLNMTHLDLWTPIHADCAQGAVNPHSPVNSQSHKALLSPLHGRLSGNVERGTSGSALLPFRKLQSVGRGERGFPLSNPVPCLFTQR